MHIRALTAGSHSGASFFSLRSLSHTAIRHGRKENGATTQEDKAQEDSKVDLTAALRSGRRLTSNIKNISRELLDEVPIKVKKGYQTQIQKTLSNDVQKAIKSLDSRSNPKTEQPRRKTNPKQENILRQPRTQANEMLLSWGVSAQKTAETIDTPANIKSNKYKTASSSRPKRLPKLLRRLKFKSEESVPDSSEDPSPQHTRRQRHHLLVPTEKSSNHILTRVLSNTAVDNSKLELLDSPKGHQVPRLAHGLDRTLFSPGVHFLQDPRTRVYNFSPNLKHIHDVSEYDKSLIPSFVSASKDSQLLELAKKHKKNFLSSTSSMTKVLTLFYLFLNNIQRKTAPKKFGLEPPEMSKLIYSLCANVIVEPKTIKKGAKVSGAQATYSITSDKSMDTELYLSALGHCLELMLTTEYGKVNVLVKNSQSNEGSNPLAPAENVYSYSTCGKFLLRSQIDCYDERLPGTGTFDLKTRAVGAIRHDSKSYSHTSFGSNYQIWRETGEFESFEREMKDLIKTGALLKYGFQARIGGMDGIYIAYHNTHEFFGFQYVPLIEIDRVFYDRSMNYNVLKLKIESSYSLENLLENLAPYVAKEQFNRSIDMWTDILQQSIQKLPKGCPFRMTFKIKKTGRNGPNRLRVFAVSMLNEENSKIDLFLNEFETSFRFRHTPDVIFKELMKHRKELDEFNKKLATENEMVVFDIDLFHPIGAEYDAHEEFKLYPSHIRDTWKTKYKIAQRNNKMANTEEYLQIMENESRFLVEGYIMSMAVPANLRQKLGEMLEKGEAGDLNPSDFEEDSGTTTISTGYRKYSDIGEKRKKQWNHRDFEAPIVYKQK